MGGLRDGPDEEEDDAVGWEGVGWLGADAAGCRASSLWKPEEASEALSCGSSWAAK